MPEASHTTPSISVDDFLTQRKAHPESVVIDVRDSAKYAEAHIPGAINLNKAEVEAQIEKTVPDKNTEIYCHCGGGQSGINAAALLNEMGYTNAKVITGGWRSYKGRTK